MTKEELFPFQGDTPNRIIWSQPLNKEKEDKQNGRYK